MNPEQKTHADIAQLLGQQAIQVIALTNQVAALAEQLKALTEAAQRRQKRASRDAS